MTTLTKNPTKLTLTDINSAKQALDHVLEPLRDNDQARTGQLVITGGYVGGKPLIEITVKRLGLGAPSIWLWGRAAVAMRNYVNAILAYWGTASVPAYHYLHTHKLLNHLKPFAAWRFANDVPEFATAREWNNFFESYETDGLERDRRETEQDALI